MKPEEVRFELLKLIEQEPEMSQRDMARELGVSLGRANYCLRALIEKGYVKAGNFRRNKNKSAYLYVLTPAGIEARVRQAAKFLSYKLQEYNRLHEEIEALRAEVHATSATPADQP